MSLLYSGLREAPAERVWAASHALNSLMIKIIKVTEAQNAPPAVRIAAATCTPPSQASTPAPTLTRTANNRPIASQTGISGSPPWDEYTVLPPWSRSVTPCAPLTREKLAWLYFSERSRARGDASYSSSEHCFSPPLRSPRLSIQHSSCTMQHSYCGTPHQAAVLRHTKLPISQAMERKGQAG